MVQFLARRRGDRMDLIVTRIPVRRHPLNDAALARAIPAFQHDDGPAAMQDMGDLDLRQAMLQRQQRRIIIAFILRPGLIVRQIDRHAPLSCKGTPD